MAGGGCGRQVCDRGSDRVGNGGVEGAQKPCSIKPKFTGLIWQVLWAVKLEFKATEKYLIMV